MKVQRGCKTPRVRRDEILDAAAKVFARKGFARTKVEEIANALGVAKGTIYLYFRSKEALFLAVADRTMSLLQNRVRSKAAEIADPLQRMSAAAYEYLGFFEENPELFEIFVHERAEFRERKDSTYMTYRERQLSILEQRLRELQSAGLVRQIDPARVSRLFGDLLYGTVYTNLLIPKRPPLTALHPHIVSVLFGGILTDKGKKQARVVD